MAERPRVSAYWFPDYHRDPRNAAWFGEGWTEWDLVRDARPRFPGHRQPRVPALGCQDESDPAVAAEHIRLAAEHGIDGFIFDTYWYDDGPYLEGALERGFLRAPNAGEVEFSVMWANHDLVDIFPSADPHAPPRLLKSGAVDRAAFERFAEHVLAEYFPRPDYTRIDGRPRFSIYEIGGFVAGLGGVAEARDALAWFDARARSLGLGGVHVDAVIWGFAVLPTEVAVQDPNRLIAELGIRSASSYVWIHHTDVGAEAFPLAAGWDSARTSAFAAYERYAAELDVPFSPNVSVGWDSSPRTLQSAPHERGTYPWGPSWEPSVDVFAAGLRQALDFCRRHPSPHPEIAINTWNEWTEGSYLLPDTVDGTSYLEAIRDVLGVAQSDRF